MPKVNVYLPDELANAVREAGIPVSPVCQKALSEAVRAVGKARLVAAALRDPGFDPAGAPRLADGLGARMTARLQEALRRAHEAAQDTTGTKHLLIGLLDAADNLGLRILQALDVDTDELRAAAERVDTAEPGGAGHAPAAAGTLAALTTPARSAIAATVEAAVELGHNYLGCEHLLLGLLRTAEGAAAAVLTDFGVEPAAVRRGVTTASAGFTVARRNADAVHDDRLESILRRLDAVEARLAAGKL
jgi:ATP-dependent Clp protease ATP-binding subunit ClpC